MQISHPTSPAEITSAWLTDVLRSGGVISTSGVRSFSPRIIGEGAGFMGQLAHLSLEYDKPEADAPSSLIAKMPAAAQENREVAQFFRFYEREVRFYDEIAETVALRTPKAYFSHFDEGSGNYVLLLEDLAPARVGDQLEGCTIALAEVALRELAKFHAAWWESPRLDALGWMPGIDADWYKAAVQDGYSKAWEPFVQFFGEKLTPEMRETCERYGKHVPAIMDQFGEKPCTIIHGDYRLDNLFFGGDASIAVVDWQISARARGIFDVAYFVAGTLPTEERRAKEHDLVSLYYKTLVECGVSDYGFDECWEDYRRSTLFLLSYSVIALGSLDMANQRGVDLFTMIATRTMNAISDLKSGELLPS
jgi:aminoglycoside/choline kinase family phosphotransferase